MYTEKKEKIIEVYVVLTPEVPNPELKRKFHWASPVITSD